MDVAKLLDAARGSEVIDRTVRHLLARCRACRRGCDALRRLCREAQHPDYVIVLAEAREAPTLWRQLAALPYPSQLAAVEADESYQRWGLCRLLQRLSGEAARQDPEGARRLANLAVRIPPFLEPAYHPDSIRDLQALSFCYLGNAWRALREPHGAADAFDAARALLLAGTGDPAIAAEALALEARLLRDRRELAEAAALLDRVEAIYAAAGGLGEGAEGAVLDDGDPERAAKARLHRAGASTTSAASRRLAACSNGQPSKSTRDANPARPWRCVPGSPGAPSPSPRPTPRRAWPPPSSSRARWETTPIACACAVPRRGSTSPRVIAVRPSKRSAPPRRASSNRISASMRR